MERREMKKLKDKKILDILKRGNVLRLYLGDTEYWYGDDWDDTPYEHNAELVYDEFVTDYVDIGFNLDWIISEPADDWNYRGNSPYCKHDFKKIPYMVVSKYDDYNIDTYSSAVARTNALKIVLGEKFGDLEYEAFGGTLLYTSKMYHKD